MNVPREPVVLTVETSDWQTGTTLGKIRLLLVATASDALLAAAPWVSSSVLAVIGALAAASATAGTRWDAGTGAVTCLLE